MKTTRLFLSVAVLVAMQQTLSAQAIAPLPSKGEWLEALVGATAASQYYGHAIENSDNVSDALFPTTDHERRTINKTNFKQLFTIIGAFASTYLGTVGTNNAGKLNIPAKYLAQLALASLASTKLLKASKKTIGKNGQAPKSSNQIFALKSFVKAAAALTMSNLCFGYAYDPIKNVTRHSLGLSAQAPLSRGYDKLCETVVIGFGLEFVRAVHQYLKRHGCKPNEIETDGYLAPERPVTAKGKRIVKPA